MLAFCLAVLLLLVTPGPGVLSTAGVGAAFGFNAGLRYVTGLCIGTNLVALIVVSGLAAIILAIDWARNTLLVLSAIYLLYLAVRIAFAGKKIAFIAATEKPGLRAGLLLQLINPKAYAVNMTWFTGFALFPGSLVSETLFQPDLDTDPPAMACRRQHRKPARPEPENPFPDQLRYGPGHADRGCAGSVFIALESLT
jgi:hypothetical protein